MGFPLEHRYGKRKILVLYVASGVLGDTLAFGIMWLMGKREMAVGASTAIFGLSGFMIGEMAIDWQHIVHKDQAIFNVASFAFFAIMMSIAPNSNIGWKGHLGGFVVGFALTPVIRWWDKYNPHR